MRQKTLCLVEVVNDIKMWAVQHTGKDNNKIRRIVVMASALVVPLLVLLKAQYATWFPPFLYGWISICITFLYDFLLFQFYKDSDSTTKTMFWIFAVMFILMYLFLALPRVSAM
jgi:amino acid permease